LTWSVKCISTLWVQLERAFSVKIIFFIKSGLSKVKT
jgi:hypothetical protein